MDEVRLSQLFSVPVSVGSIRLEKERQKSIDRTITKIRKEVPSGKPESWSCDVYTTLNTLSNVHELPEFSDLISDISRKATAFSKAFAYDVDKFPLRISSCWLNVYSKWHSQEIHLHPNNVISAIYYFQAPEGAGKLLFHSPMSDLMYDPPKTEVNSLNTKISAIVPENSMLILFPSWLKHSVTPDNSRDGIRVSMAMNFMM